MKKHFWKSKTFWVNLLGIGAIVSQWATGTEVIDAEAQVAILAVVNLVLRLVTKEAITW